MDERRLESIPRLSWAQYKKCLAEKTPFAGISPMGSALISVKRFEPIIGLAVHSGHRVREELLSKMAIDENDRTYEEDTSTEDFVSDFPIQMIGLDSRYEYDINRTPDQAVYLKPFQAWGKKVWQTPPTKEELEESLQKHDEFHEMLGHLVEEMSRHCGKVLVLDVHAYNYKRQNQVGRQNELPLFNLATSPHDQKAHRLVLDTLTAELKKFDLPGFPATVKENDIFKKDGAIAMMLEPKYPNCPVIPLEIKKVYMDELSGEVHPNQIAKIRTALTMAAQAAAKRLA